MFLGCYSYHSCISNHNASEPKPMHSGSSTHHKAEFNSQTFSFMDLQLMEDLLFNLSDSLTITGLHWWTNIFFLY